MTTIDLAAQLNLLIARLARLKTDRIGISDAGCSQDVIDERDRFAAHQSLVAVIDFLSCNPEWMAADLDFALRRLMVALNNINDGRTEHWLVNPADHRPPDSIEIWAARGRCAGVMQILMDKKWKRPAAAKYVVQHLPAPTMARLAPRTPHGGEDWKRVAGWRDDVSKNSNPGLTALTTSFKAQLALAASRPESAIDICKATLNSLARDFG